MDLPYKFVFGSLLLAGVSLGLPELLRAAGLDLPAWGTLAVALGVGGGIGFGSSRLMQRKVERLFDLSAQIREGGLCLAGIHLGVERRFHWCGAAGSRWCLVACDCAPCGAALR